MLPNIVVGNINIIGSLDWAELTGAKLRLAGCSSSAHHNKSPGENGCSGERKTFAKIIVELPPSNSQSSARLETIAKLLGGAVQPRASVMLQSRCKYYSNSLADGGRGHGYDEDCGDDVGVGDLIFIFSFIIQQAAVSLDGRHGPD